MDDDSLPKWLMVHKKLVMKWALPSDGIPATQEILELVDKGWTLSRSDFTNRGR